MKHEALDFLTRLNAADMKPSTVQFEIDGLMYTSTKLPASLGLEVWPRVTALLGNAMTRAVVTGDVADMDIGQSLVGLADRAMRDGLVPLVRDLLSRMKCNKLRSSGQGGDVLGDFDAHFAGDYAHLLKVCVLALSHNLRGPTYGVH